MVAQQPLCCFSFNLSAIFVFIQEKHENVEVQVPINNKIKIRMRSMNNLLVSYNDGYCSKQSEDSIL